MENKEELFKNREPLIYPIPDAYVGPGGILGEYHTEWNERKYLLPAGYGKKFYDSTCPYSGKNGISRHMTDPVFREFFIKDPKVLVSLLDKNSLKSWLEEGNTLSKTEIQNFRFYANGFQCRICRKPLEFYLVDRWNMTQWRDE